MSEVTSPPSETPEPVAMETEAKNPMTEVTGERRSQGEEESKVKDLIPE